MTETTETTRQTVEEAAAQTLFDRLTGIARKALLEASDVYRETRGHRPEPRSLALALIPLLIDLAVVGKARA